MSLFFTCIKIFFARILDVSLNTIRTTFVLRGKTSIVAIIAFLEITIWFLVARTALNTELNLFIVLSYSGGYTMGTIIGTIFTNKIIRTNIEILVISDKIRSIKKIKDNNFGATIISKDNNRVIFIINTTKKRLDELTSLISELDNKAFITVKETRTIINGYI
jgi:uncharacterized protein YebE (UPF0316 family)